MIRISFLLKRCLLCVVLSVGLLFSGCLPTYQVQSLLHEVDKVQSDVADVAKAIGEVDYADDEMLNLLKALQAGNAASSPFNPYALPIGGALAGLIALLEGLRRKEQGARKYAEHELNNGSKVNGK